LATILKMMNWIENTGRDEKNATGYEPTRLGHDGAG